MNNFLVLIVLGFLCGCATLKDPPALDEHRALEIGKHYAHDKGWYIRHVWQDITFRQETGEWQMFFDIQNQGGPNIVYVNDKTRNVRFERGE